MDNAPLTPLDSRVSHLRRRAPLRSSLDQPRMRDGSGRSASSALATADRGSNRPARPGTTGNPPTLRPFVTTTTTTTSTSTSASPVVNASTVSTTNTSVAVTTATSSVAVAGALALPRPRNRASQVRHDTSNLYGAILARDASAAVQRMREGERIFASPDGKGAAFTMFQLALKPDAYDCALAMLRHCGPQDALERDARLLDLFQDTLQREQWGTVGTLLALFGEIKLRMRSRNYAMVFHFMVSRRKLDCARALLALGPCQALTQKQLIQMTRNALAFGNGVLMKSLVAACPDVPGLHANWLERALERGKARAVAALLLAGFVWPGLNEEKLSTLLVNLLGMNEEVAACDLLKKFPLLKPRFGELLLAAIRNGAPDFLRHLLKTKHSRAEQWQETLYAALLHAVEEGYCEALQVLKAHGIELFQQPKAALSLVARLVQQGDTRVLAPLIQSAQVPAGSIFLRLIRHQKVEALGELQERLGLSFCNALRAKFLLPETSAVCTSFLAGLLTDLRDVAQATRNRREKMMCLLMQSGCCWYTALNLVDMRESLVASGTARQGHFERQFLLLVAAMLEGLKFADCEFWPGPQRGVFSGVLLAEQQVLITLGSKVLLNSSEILMAELDLALNGGPGATPDLGQRLQMQAGLPPEFARLVEAACRQALQAQAQASRPGDVARITALARALFAGLEQIPEPPMSLYNSLSVWHSACRVLLRSVINRLHFAARQ